MTNASSRLRGRAAVAQRKRRLATEPLCRHCAAKDIVTPATVPDHIIPLDQGGSDDDDNIQCLCEACHKLKTAAESVHRNGAINHPDWLQRSNIPLTIVAGPPCSGKTTYVSQYADELDTIICLDTILTDLRPGYQHWSGMLDRDLLNKAIRVRNAMLGSLDRATRGKAWFIVSAPAEEERKWWQSKLGGELLLLHPGLDECKRRAISRGTPAAIKGIDDWDRASRMVWTPPATKRPKQAVGSDGWPSP